MESNHSDLTQALDAAVTNRPKVSLDQLIGLCVEHDASDIHFGEGSRIALRVAGKITFVENIQALSHEDIEAIVNGMLSNPDERKRLERVRELDFSYTHSSGVSFRVNAFYQRGRLSLVMRMISKETPSLEALGLPAAIRDLLNLREGLILVTGSAGAGKSTTIQAMLEHINQNSVEHIITIEDPIEHLFEEKKSIISQRELGKDTLTLANALRSAVREDPNIIMVSEIADAETLDQVLTVVETGHLVISSMLTKNPRQTLERMVSFYPESRQAQVRSRLAENLLAILSQDLVERADQAGRVAIYGLLINNVDIRPIIKRGTLPQIKNALQSDTSQGMVDMENFARRLAEQGVISEEAAGRFVEQE